MVQGSYGALASMARALLFCVLSMTASLLLPLLRMTEHCYTLLLVLATAVS